MDIKNKHITILGAVRSGIAAAKLIKKLGGIPFVSDMVPYEKLSASFDVLTEAGINFEAGGHTDKVYDCDFIVTSPGVPSNAKVMVEALEKGIEVISELELAASFCEGDIIAITGSNGKTTTTMLTAHVFNHCGLKTHLAGNIGRAFSDVVLEVKKGEVVALEVSSFQLDFIKNFHPKVSAILNLTPDHLDRYGGSFNRYSEAKLRIFSNQIESDYYISNDDDLKLSKSKGKSSARNLTFSVKHKIERGSYLNMDSFVYANDNTEEIICSSSDLSIRGEHNIANALAVVCFAKIFNLNSEKIKEAFSTFPGVEHRLEFVRKVDAVEYINDSKATNVDSVWFALRSFDKPLYLILGGKDKGNDYSLIFESVKQNVKKIYAIGSSAKKVSNYFSDVVDVEIKETLEDAVQSARKEAAENSIVLLSPACASFDMFDDYEHRGKVFKEAVMRLPE
ncbi:MAG: UDP-N-acetylmuramoyl-L-alanine--D-glutamate ligase [Bacteroidetes bacterium]|nr:UDP-N-acetylmuramoyl-L-alanine--D-glutamate ligase [Bacteroidota bacterium]